MPGEKRVAVIPQTAEKLVQLGALLEIESGLGAHLGFPDAAYTSVGATVAVDRKASLAKADLVLRVRKPETGDIKAMKKGALIAGALDPFNSKALLQQCCAAGVDAVSMEMVPRTTLAQKMDVLSSQANLAGYVSVILAAERMNKILPMMMTPAGTISPARVFIIGVGVAGLQAIATAKRLGAMVEAFDTRPVVEEQVKSLGAKFVKVDLGETGQTKDGYAKALTEEQLQKQREAMAKHCALADIVITTAQIFGKKAPRIVTAEMIRGMRPGSIVVDMAIESGGNVEGAVLDQEVDVNGVCLIGLGNLPSRVAVNASQMYASNLFNFVEHFWDKEKKVLDLRLSDEIMKGALVVHNGAIANETLKKIFE